MPCMLLQDADISEDIVWLSESVLACARRDARRPQARPGFHVCLVDSPKAQAITGLELVCQGRSLVVSKQTTDRIDVLFVHLILMLTVVFRRRHIHATAVRKAKLGVQIISRASQPPTEPVSCQLLAANGRQLTEAIESTILSPGPEACQARWARNGPHPRRCAFYTSGFMTAARTHG